MRKMRSGRRSAVAIWVMLGLIVGISAADAADESATAQDAKAMIERAAAALKKDEAAALAAFTAGAEGFKDRDLYVFCSDVTTGLASAHGADPSRVGRTKTREQTDANGKKFGEEIYAVADEDEFHIVEYVWPRPGESDPVPKASYVTKVDDQICGVGYYK